IWARQKIEDLMAKDWSGIQSGNSKYKAEIVEVGLKHSLATQFTSFVAVEEKTVVQDGKPIRIEVPVELPAGVSPLAVPSGDRLEAFAKLSKAPNVSVGGGVGAGNYMYRTVQPSATPAPPLGGPAYNGRVGTTSETVEVQAQTATVDTMSIAKPDKRAVDRERDKDRK